MMLLPPDLLGEFASTFKEWHYFVAGFSGGGIIGAAATAEYIRRHFELEESDP